jgi:flagellin
MAEQSNILDTVKAKLIQANTDTTSADGREAIRKDIAKLLEQLDNIAKQTNYNGTTLLQASRADDSASSGLSFQVGENDGDLITNTSIQSNTQGLAGAELSVAAAATAGTDDLSTGDAQLVKHGGTTTAVTLTAASGTASVSLSGKVGVLGAASGESLTISNVSSADKLQLDALAVSNADFTNNNDGTYTLTNGSAASTLDLGSYNVNSITVDSSTTIISLTGDTANDRFSVQNLATAVTTIAGGDTGTTIGLSLDSLRILGEDALTQELADIYQGVVDTSISTLNSYRGDIGSTQNQVESAVRNLMTQATNVQAAESIIRDVDYAAESANFNKQNIISQAGSYAISQANQVSQNILRLLQ